MHLSELIKKPRFTEKATVLSGHHQPVYTFVVAPDSNKSELAKEVKRRYGVKPEKINLLNLPAKRVVRKGKRGWKPGARKALVFLKPGDKIDFA